VTSIIAGTARRTRAQDRFLSRLADNDRWLWRAMLAPAIFYIILLVGFPFLLSIYYSLSSATVASQEAHFVGLENFRRIVDSRTFWLSLQNTIVITIVSQFLVMVLANILATALAIDFRDKWLVRLLILLPWVAPISLGSIGWLWNLRFDLQRHQLDGARPDNQARLVAHGGALEVRPAPVSVPRRHLAKGCISSSADLIPRNRFIN